MSILGHLEDLPLPGLLQIVSMGKRSGVLTIISREGSGRILLNRGRVIYASSDVRKRIGYVLIEKGLVSLRQLNEVLQSQKLSEEKRPLGTLLVEKELITQEQLWDILKPHITEVFADFLKWEHGIFYFEKDWLLNRELTCNEGLTVERLLLQAAQLNDEGAREPEVELWH